MLSILVRVVSYIAWQVQTEAVFLEERPCLHFHSISILHRSCFVFYLTVAIISKCALSSIVSGAVAYSNE
jgi:hypothetical protein